MKFILEILKEFIENKRSSFIVIFLMILSAIYFTSTSIVFQIFIDDVIKKNNYTLFIYCSSYLIMGFILAYFANLYMLKLSMNLGTLVVTNIKKGLIYNLCIKNKKTNTDDKRASQCFDSDVDRVEYFILHEFLDLLENVAYMILSLGFLFYLGWPFILIGILGVSITLFVSYWFEKKSATSYHAQKEKSEQLSSLFKESLTNYRITRFFDLRRWLFNRFEKHLQSYQSKSAIYNYHSEMIKFGSTAACNGIQTAIYIIWIALILKGYCSVGQFFAFIGLYEILTGCMMLLIEKFTLLSQSSLSYFQIKSFEPKTKEKQSLTIEKPKPRAPLKEKITFEQVSFGFTPDKKIVENIQLSIFQGQRVAFVGSSGSGKSTLLRILMGELHPQQGDIRIDGKKLRGLDIYAHMHDSSVVLQEVNLFNLSIKDNIRLGKLDATEEEIITAAKNAMIHDTILMQPKGYETLIGQGGSNLSGGQMQRISVARALIKTPDILYLDEATSALDPINKVAFNEVVSTLHHQSTVISVTHDLQSIIKFDQIFVLDNGRLVEQGTHTELLKLGGIYTQLWEKQTGIQVDLADHTFTITPTWLKRIPLFHTLSTKSLEALAERFDIKTAEQGACIIEQGQEGEMFYIIAKGSVEVSQSDNQGKTKKVAELEMGDFFGEISLLYKIECTASVTATMPVILLTLPKATFKHFYLHLPKEAQTLLQSIAKERMEKSQLSGNVLL